jgi:hypothetical protein
MPLHTGQESRIELGFGSGTGGDSSGIMGGMARAARAVDILKFSLATSEGMGSGASDQVARNERSSMFHARCRALARMSEARLSLRASGTYS